MTAIKRQKSIHGKTRKKIDDLIKKIVDAHRYVRVEVLKQYKDLIEKFPKLIDQDGIAAIVRLLSLTYLPAREVQELALSIYKFMLRTVPHLIDGAARKTTDESVQCDVCKTPSLDLRVTSESAFRLCPECLSKNTVLCPRCGTPFFLGTEKELRNALAEIRRYNPGLKVNRNRVCPVCSTKLYFNIFPNSSVG